MHTTRNGQKPVGERAPTERQVEVLATIHALSLRGFPPTFRELGEALQISSLKGVVDHLEALKARGLVSWLPNKQRTLVLTDAGRKVIA